MLITLVLGGSGAIAFGTLVRGWLDLRRGTRAIDRGVVKDAVADRDQAEARTARAERDRDYWRSVAGGYHWQLRTAGVMPLPEMPVPPSERIAGGTVPIEPPGV